MGAEDQDVTRTQGWSRDGERVEPRAPSEPSVPEPPPSDATSAPEDAAEAPLPKTIGNYRILSKLGEGGMGVVYEAVQSNPRREVALMDEDPRTDTDKAADTIGLTLDNGTNGERDIANADCVTNLDAEPSEKAPFDDSPPFCQSLRHR